MQDQITSGNLSNSTGRTKLLEVDASTTFFALNETPQAFSISQVKAKLSFPEVSWKDIVTKVTFHFSPLRFVRCHHFFFEPNKQSSWLNSSNLEQERSERIVQFIVSSTHFGLRVSEKKTRQSLTYRSLFIVSKGLAEFARSTNYSLSLGSDILQTHTLRGVDGQVSQDWANVVVFSSSIL